MTLCSKTVDAKRFTKEEQFHGIDPESKYPTALGRLVEVGEMRMVGTLPAWLGGAESEPHSITLTPVSTS